MTVLKTSSPVFAPSLRDYDGRDHMRSLADALQKLRELTGLRDHEEVEIRTSTVKSGERASGLVVVLGPPRTDIRWVVGMPSAAKFTARTTRDDQQTFEIGLLNGANSDADGNVELSDGGFIHQIDLIPAPFMRRLTWSEEFIVRLAVKYLGLTEVCYPQVDKNWLPRIRALRFDEIAKIRIAHVKPMIRYVTEHRVSRYLTARGHLSLSASIITKALASAGMQLPRSSMNRSHNSATMEPR